MSRVQAGGFTGEKQPPARIFRKRGVTKSRRTRRRQVMPFRSICLATLLALFAVCGPVRAQRLSPLAPAPDWKRLDAFRESITKEEFLRLLETVFAPGGAAAGVIECRDSEAVIFTKL